MKSKTLLEVLDNRFSHLKFNKVLASKFYKFHIDFTHKNEEHMRFFGGNLMGVDIVRFTNKEVNIFFNDILDSDIDDIADDILECKAINQDFTVSSDTFNLVCMFIIHGFLTLKFLTSNLLNDKEKDKAALDVALIFNIRVLTSLMSHYFKYPADEATAKATYANLSFKYLIKRLGSWNEVLLYRSNEMVVKGGLHRNTFEKFNDDEEIVKMVNDCQGRVRDLLKNVYAEFIRVHESKERIHTSTSTMIDTDGVEVIKDKSHGLENYTNYILNVVPDYNSFIKKELVDIVLDLMQTTQRNNFIKTLEWITANITNKKYDIIEEFVKLTMVHSYEYLENNSTTLHHTKDLAGFMSRLRGVYLSSRSTDSNLLQLRELGHKLITDAIKISNDNSVSSIRTSIMLYINLRAYTKNHYTH